MPADVTITIDDQEVTVPAGALVVDAAKRIGNDIPVFCYHPKLEPVGMCRMCLVEVGTPMRDRATGEPVLEDDGAPKIGWRPGLVTACTERVSPGMQVRTANERVARARKDVVEFLLTSHPLDCPICDKGGECPLQNQTMRYGPGASRFIVGEKFHLDKHVPLGDLIYLDQERCIQCARCVRFQEELADDAVIGFEERGRALQIVSYSDPGFDSYFSGNTTDICPVGALTTADFRFGARPWELHHSASICPHCPVGCNIHLNTRRSGVSGDNVIKRVMPRQNELVNEIWICDKGRFGHHFATSAERITIPLIRDAAGELVEATWDEALELVADKMRAAEGGVAGLAGERLSNEDLFSFRTLVEGAGGRVAQWPGRMGGGELVQQAGVGVGTDIPNVGADTVILVVASDLEEEAPVWWLRVKQAATKHGSTLDKSRATLIVANARPTKLDRYAAHRVRYNYGDEVTTVLAVAHAAAGEKAGVAASIASSNVAGVAAAGAAIAAAENLIVFFGGEGLSVQASASLAQACANLVIATGHVGRANNGIIPVWPHNNTQGAWDMGVPASGVAVSDFANGAQVVLAAGADPVGAGESLPEAFTVAVELFMTPTAQAADVVLPAQSFVEREGTYTSGERRVQRFHPALPARGQTQADWKIYGQISERLGQGAAAPSAAAVFLQIARAVPAYAGLTYQKLAALTEQVPDATASHLAAGADWRGRQPVTRVGGIDLYYGGTAFKNSVGLGVQYPTTAEQGEELTVGEVQPVKAPTGKLMAVPITVLYDHGTTFAPSKLMEPRRAAAYVELNAVDAAKLKVSDGDDVIVVVGDHEFRSRARVDGRVPQGAILAPRSLGGPALAAPVPAKVSKAG
ncbi:MAG: NADH-quinone oxidoreductase subunit NuoG [Anaerolineales bacterium]